jgi:hypothetical protein
MFHDFEAGEHVWPPFSRVQAKKPVPLLDGDFNAAANSTHHSRPTGLDDLTLHQRQSGTTIRFQAADSCLIMLGSALFLLFSYGPTTVAVYSPEREHTPCPLSTEKAHRPILISAFAPQPHAKPSGEFGKPTSECSMLQIVTPM